MQRSIGLDDKLDIPRERQGNVEAICWVCSMNNWEDIYISIC